MSLPTISWISMIIMERNDIRLGRQVRERRMKRKMEEEEGRDQMGARGCGEHTNIYQYLGPSRCLVLFNEADRFLLSHIMYCRESLKLIIRFTLLRQGQFHSQKAINIKIQILHFQTLAWNQSGRNTAHPRLPNCFAHMREFQVMFAWATAPSPIL